ncbi:hypothetical protein GDO81_019919 [Engystomops pustulosus]|uniref:Uncharacterized protein n=1 Tax=Engystomops pustulosus TaxID=76066 RepID=A0AAV6ZF63_ENGPU|nr:hypothetical protein GDO81_019919 [Engystomops pustulosus]
MTITAASPAPPPLYLSDSADSVNGGNFGSLCPTAAPMEAPTFLPDRPLGEDMDIYDTPVPCTSRSLAGPVTTGSSDA